MVATDGGIASSRASRAALMVGEVRFWRISDKKVIPSEAMDSFSWRVKVCRAASRVVPGTLSMVRYLNSAVLSYLWTRGTVTKLCSD